MTNPAGPDDLCIDAYLPGEMFDPAQLPDRIDVLSTSSEELALAWDLRWQTGQELRIRFLDGDPELRRRVEQHARTWLQHANLRFTFGNHPVSEIRVTFSGLGYWSMVGKEALHIRQSQPTMQLGAFTANTEEELLRRTVLHEFGHAIGCIHEQASPAVAIPWDEDRVYAFYQQQYGWGRDQTFNNVLLRYNGEARYTDHDPNSIMQYPVLPELTRDGFSVGWNSELSDQDRSFIARMYPSKNGND